jgi:hypothetical protein
MTSIPDADTRENIVARLRIHAEYAYAAERETLRRAAELLEADAAESWLQYGALRPYPHSGVISDSMTSKREAREMAERIGGTAVERTVHASDWVAV